jgi:hypothetical protein
VPVTLNRFLALEFVLTLGILNAFLDDTLMADPHRRTTYGAGWAIKMDGEGIKKTAQVRFFSILL